MVNQTCCISFTRQLRSRPCGHGSARWFVLPHETMHHPSCARRSTCSLHWKVRKPGKFKCKFHHFEVCPPGKTARIRSCFLHFLWQTMCNTRWENGRTNVWRQCKSTAGSCFHLTSFFQMFKTLPVRMKAVWLYDSTRHLPGSKKQRCYKSTKLRNNSDQDWGNHDCRDKIMIRKRRMHKKKHEETHFKTAKQELNGKARAKRADNSTNIRITHNSTAKSTRKELCFLALF